MSSRQAKRFRSDSSSTATSKLDLAEWMHRIETTTRSLDMTRVEGIPTVRAMLAWMKVRGKFGVAVGASSRDGSALKGSFTAEG